MRPPAPHAEPEPIDRREGQFRPVVEEAVLAIVRIHDIFAFAVQFELPPAERSLEARGDTGRVAEDTAEHGREFPLQRLATCEIDAHPRRDSIEPFVVAARFEVQPVPVGGDSWLHIIAVVRQRVGIGRDGERPGVLLRCSGSRRVRRLGLCGIARENSSNREYGKRSHG